MNKSVGLIILTSEGGILRVLCQIRADFNREKNKPESYPGCLQVTCHGGLEDGEDFHEALMRESVEELGEEFTRACQEDVELTEVLTVRNEKKWVTTYMAIVPPTRMRMLKAGKDVDGFRSLTIKDVEEIIPITPDMKEHGAPEGKLAMFADEIEAIKKAFEMIS